ncbi:type I-E CRISPR-associated protein Cas5/CasD, partial [Cribrihabitans sp. XS_ASV171]
IDKIHVLEPIRFQTIMRNEVKTKASEHIIRQVMSGGSARELVKDIRDTSNVRVQRSTTALRSVAYGIEAHFEMTNRAGPEDSPAKHASMFERRASRGQCHHRPSLGLREFAADFELVQEFSKTRLEESTRDFGIMLLIAILGNSSHSMATGASYERLLTAISLGYKSALLIRKGGKLLRNCYGSIFSLQPLGIECIFQRRSNPSSGPRTSSRPGERLERDV